VRHYHRKPICPETGCSGLLVPCDGGYEITVHAGEPLERQNFSTAHEIVHTFFREACPSPLPSPQEEKLCDLGAAELTMPARRFAACLAAASLSLAGLDERRHEFAVSFEAAARRAIDLTDEPACLLIATVTRPLKQERLSTGQPALRVIKSWQSRTWPQEDSYENQIVSLASLVGQAFTHQDQRQGRTSLGIASRSGIYVTQARGYAYPLPGNPSYRQVVALARIVG
jgi:Zn-dependent peptidase ImmA (M78 family)